MSGIRVVTLPSGMTPVGLGNAFERGLGDSWTFSNARGAVGCPYGQNGNVYQSVGYLLAALILIGALRWGVLFFDRNNQQRPDSDRFGLAMLIAVQVYAAYILYVNCMNCDCWSGLLKGMGLAVIANLVAQSIYGENFSLDRLRMGRRVEDRFV